MDPPGRRYLSTRCDTAVLICSFCDHGQRYYASECAQQARADSVREAGRRCQMSPRGRRSRLPIERIVLDCRHPTVRIGTPPPGLAPGLEGVISLT